MYIQSDSTAETNPKLVKPEGVDEENNVEDEVAKDAQEEDDLRKKF